MQNKILEELRNINSMLTIGMPINAYDQMHIINRASNKIESLSKKIKELEEQVDYLQESNIALHGVSTRPSWVSVRHSLPEDGVHVFVKRRNKFCERAELSSLYFDGLPAWYLPEGPTPADTDVDVTHWMYIN